jgi:ATP-dependent RNA helicase DDX23/PRP28
VFLFDWDASEDTSTDINPLYAKRHDPKILFGKGYMGGVDQNEQKKLYDSKEGKHY